MVKYDGWPVLEIYRQKQKIFLKNPRLSMMVYVFDKMKDERKRMILSKADKFIKQNTIK